VAISPCADLTERQAFLVLNALPEIGPITLNRLLIAFGGDPRSVLRASPLELAAVEGVGLRVQTALRQWVGVFDPVQEEERMSKSGTDFLTPRDPSYPGLLRQIHDPPIGLYRRGGYDFERTCVAIVGTRRATLYGKEVAWSLGAELGRLGFCVVSGLARGIDTAAHEGALSVAGKTVGVLGTGPDAVYPPENGVLFRRIKENGALLSEFPFGRPAIRQSFPMRNRVVSGMSAAVVVVESAVDGGAMITARFAGEQGRNVFAVPGRIDQATSAGCHQLIRDGATLLTSVEDILSELSYLGGPQPGSAGPMAVPDPGKTHSAPDEILPADEAAVLACFAGGAILGADVLAARTGLAAGPLSAALLMLEIKRRLEKRLDGTYEECRSKGGLKGSG
jgi:DNA processing protein